MRLFTYGDVKQWAHLRKEGFYLGNPKEYAPAGTDPLMFDFLIALGMMDLL